MVSANKLRDLSISKYQIHFKQQSTYFSLHSHHIEALVELASLNFFEDLPLSKIQLEKAKTIQDSRGILKYFEKIDTLQIKILEIESNKK